MKDGKMVRMATSAERPHMNRFYVKEVRFFFWNFHAKVKILGELRQEVKFMLTP